MYINYIDVNSTYYIILLTMFYIFSTYYDLTICSSEEVINIIKTL
jgi:hypothetical protein